MTITYTYHPAKRRIHTSCVGHVAVVDVVNHFHLLALDPEIVAGADVQLDLLGMTSLPETEQIDEAVEQLGRVAQRRALGRCAIVAAAAPTVATARMFEAAAAGAFKGIRLFTCAEDATSWLDQRA